MTGTGLYLKEVKPSIARVGVCTSPGERVPGPRMFSLLAPVEFPWRDAVDCIEEVGPFESYEKSLELCRNGLLVGPSSGLALLGLFKFLEKKKKKNELDGLRNDSGAIPCVFICCDQPFQYIAEYYEKLGPSYFLPIRNEELRGVDQYDYNVDWEVDVETAHKMLATSISSSTSEDAVPVSNLVLLDLRDEADFNAAHIPNSLNLDIGARDRPNPYKDPATMVAEFKILDSRLQLSDPVLGPALANKIVLTLSYSGHVGRLAMSILRKRGLQAHCVMGGLEAWKQAGLWDDSCALVNQD